MKKAQSLVPDKVVIIVLVILVIFAVLMFIFNVDILEYLRNLPDYVYGEDREIKISEISEAQVETLCPVGVGYIESVKKWGGFRSVDFIFLNNEQTNLIWLEDKIELDEWENEDVAVVEDGKISVIKEWFSAEKYKKHKKMPSLLDLKSLDGAYKLPEINYICRTGEVSLEDEK